jgi:hypothetical protein
MNCLAKSTQRTGEPEAPARASVPERFRRLKWDEVGLGKRRPYSEPARLRDQFTGRKRPKDSDRPQPESQNKTQNIAMKTPKITAYLKPTCGWSEGVRAILGKSQSALRYHQQSAQLH